MSDYDPYQSVRNAEEQGARDLQNLGRGAGRTSGFESPLLWGMVGALLGGLLGRGLIGALVGAAILGGGFALLKRGLISRDGLSDRAVLKWAILGALVGMVGAFLFGRVSLMLCAGLGGASGALAHIAKARLKG